MASRKSDLYIPKVIEEREYRGYWWLPEDEGRKLSGTLTVTKGVVKLELLEDFGHQLISETDTEKTYSLSLEERPRILGISTDGKWITLEGHHGASTVKRFPGIPTSIYRRAAAFIGAHFEPGEEVGFNEIAIEASDLNAWTQVSGFGVQIGFEKHEEKDYDVVSRIGVTFEPPDDIEIPLARGERAFIRFHAPGEGLGGGTDHVTLRQEAALHLRFARRASFEHVVERVGQLRNFLSLAVGRPVAITTVTGYQDDLVDKRGASVPIELLWKIPHNPDPPKRRRMPREMLFTLPEAQPDIARVMRAWLAKQERLEPVFNLFFGSRYHPDLTIDVRFLLHAQAADTYDYRWRRKPGKDFVTRIGNLLDRCNTVSKKIVGPSPADRQAFIEAVKVARNYYTHYNPKLEGKAARGGALYLLLVQMQAILEMALLRELRFPARTIDEILERVERYAEIEHFKGVMAEEQDAERRHL